MHTRIREIDAQRRPTALHRPCGGACRKEPHERHVTPAYGARCLPQGECFGVMRPRLERLRSSTYTTRIRR
jgi:hypothetical protein